MEAKLEKALGRPRLSLVRRLKLRHLELLRNIFVLRVLGKAADASAMTQPAATKLVQEMEDIFGVPLFLRDVRGMTPTPFGEALARHAGVVLGDVDRMQDELMLLANGSEGRIRIGVLPSLAPQVLDAAIARTLQAHPQVRFMLRHGASTKLMRDLENNELDMCIVRVVSGLVKRKFDLRPLYEENYWVVCRPQHPAAQPGARDWRSLDSPDWVLPDDDSPLRELIDSVFVQNAQLQPVARMECDSFDRMRSLVGCENVLCLLPEQTALAGARAGSLHVLDTEFGRRLAQISLASRSEVVQSALVNTLIESIEAASAEVSRAALLFP